MTRARRLCVIALACAAAAGACRRKPPSAAANPPATPAPPFVLAPLPGGDPRRACASAPDFQPYAGSDERDKLRAALREGRGDDAARWAQALLKVSPCDIAARVLEAGALESLGRAEEAKALRIQASALIDSLMATGDGKTAATAFQVISPSEEYSALMILGAAEKSQSLVELGGRQYDRLEVEDRKTGKTGELYFDVSVPMRRQVEIFGGTK